MKATTAISAAGLLLVINVAQAREPLPVEVNGREVSVSVSDVTTSDRTVNPGSTIDASNLVADVLGRGGTTRFAVKAKQPSQLANSREVSRVIGRS